MKFILTPNNLQISDKYVTYSIPPPLATVLGWQRLRSQITNEYNTAIATNFNYTIVNPDISIPLPPQAADVFLSLQDL